MISRGRRIAYGLVAALVAAAIYVSWQQTDTVAATPDAVRPAAALIPSMLGTRPDGQLRQLADEQLVLSPELIYLFDYYLAGLGEQPLAILRAEIQRELEQRLTGLAIHQARRLLDAYLDYKRALARLEHELPRNTDLVSAARARLHATQQLRSSYFTAKEAAALFGAADAYDEDAIARMEISSNPQLTAAQRQQRWQALDASLTAEQRDERRAPSRILDTEQAVAQARQQGADDNEVYRMRSAAFSPSAAARLAELDKEEADWQRRISSYQSQRRALLEQASTTPAALQQLRNASFSAAEQLRLGAYEQ